MPRADPEILLQAMNLPPEEAIAFFKAKGFEITWSWHEMQQEAHTRAFTVAKAMSYDILRDIHESVLKAHTDGITFRQFQKELEPKLKAKGWWGKQEITREDGTVESVQLGSPWRLKTIFQTNLASSYMAGRERQMREVADVRPFWQYIAVLDGMTRPAHRELHGKVFRHDDPFWDHFYPPNGYNCRCAVRSLSGREIARDGLKVFDSEGQLVPGEVHDQVSGRVYKTTRYRSPDNMRFMNPDEGFDQNPARVQEKLLALERQKKRDVEKAIGSKLPEFEDPNPAKITRQKPGDKPLSQAPKTPVETDVNERRVPETVLAKQEEEKARELGVEADYGGQPVPGNLMNQVLEEEKQAGHPLVKRIVVGDNPRYPWGSNNDDPAHYEDKDQTIYLNPSYAWRVSDKLTETAFDEGVWSSPSRLHLGRHEVGHWLHHQRNSRVYLLLKNSEFREGHLEIITGKVSDRATANPLEFVAEVYAGLKAGMKFVEEVMKVYEFYGGPIP